MAERMFPLQISRNKDVQPGPLSIPWSVAEKAYGAYAREYGRDQSMERMAERGGFGWCEMDTLYPQWRAEVDEIADLRERNRKLFEALDGIHEDCANKLDDDYVFALCVLKEERAHREREASDE